MRRSRVFLAWSLAAGILLVTAMACNIPQVIVPSSPGPAPLSTLAPATGSTATALPEAASETPTAIVHTTHPADPPASFLSQIQDINSSAFASQHRAPGGENFNLGLFERPFDQSMNTYYPDLDIKAARFSRDATWSYVTIDLVGQDPTKGGMPEVYAIEIDVNRDGRGYFLISVRAPGVGWSTDGVQVWQDTDRDVGGLHPIESDPPPQTGNGYETLLFDQGKGTDPDLAWGRISQLSSNSVQIAFKRTLFNDANPFLWGAWSFDPSMFHPDWFDYNDHFTQAQAGSPLVEQTQYYPLKALYEVDNTCRWAVGFIPTGNEPGICPIPATPTPIPSPTRTPTRTPTPTRTWTPTETQVIIK